ncbi:hypothetical protein Tco_0000990 [Tanacetum coccineum]
MRSSHQLRSLVSRIPHSSTAITERPSHSSYAGPSRKRSRSLTTSVPVSSPIPEVLSSVHDDLLPPCKRIRSSNFATNLEDCSDESSESSVPRETSLRDDVVVKGAEGIDDRVVVETVTREEVETSTRGMVEVRVDRVTHLVVSDDIAEPAEEEGAVEVTYETLGGMVYRFHDHTIEIPVHRVQVIESIQRDQGHRIVAMVQQSTVQSERISKLERDNTRLRGMLDIASQIARGMTMHNTRSGATMTREVVDNLIDRQVAEALEARDAARNLEPLAEGGDE